MSSITAIASSASALMGGGCRRKSLCFDSCVEVVALGVMSSVVPDTSGDVLLPRCLVDSETSSRRGSCGSASAVARVRNISFSEDCKKSQGKIGKQLIKNNQTFDSLFNCLSDSDILFNGLDAGGSIDLESLSDSSPSAYCSHDEIVTLFNHQLSNDLWSKHAVDYDHHSHSGRKRIWSRDLLCVDSMARSFNLLLHKAVEKVILTDKVETGIKHIKESMHSFFMEDLADDKDDTFPDKKSKESHVLVHNIEVYRLCFPIIMVMLTKPSVCFLLESFFLEVLQDQSLLKGP